MHFHLFILFLMMIKARLQSFPKCFYFFIDNFLIKSDLTSKLSSSLHVYYKFRKLVIKKLLQGDDSRFFTPGVTWVAPAGSCFSLVLIYYKLVAIQKNWAL
jgi:hypothetical protein